MPNVDLTKIVESIQREKLKGRIGEQKKINKKKLLNNILTLKKISDFFFLFFFSKHLRFFRFLLSLFCYGSRFLLIKTDTHTQMYV